MRYQTAPLPVDTILLGSVRAGCERAFVSEPLRRCSRCGLEKPPGDFSTKRRVTGQLDTYCRPCRSAYGKHHYAVNRQRYIDQAVARKRALADERTAYLLAYFEGNPCTECGERDPLILEFDHVGEKAFSIGPKLATRTWQAILEEIAKCEVVCANCHRRRTARRAGFRRFRFSSGEAGDRA